MQTTKLKTKENITTKTKYENIAVIDTETNYYDQVMSIGIVISNSKEYDVIDAKYFIITPEYKVGGMFSYELDIKSNKDNIRTRDEAINEIIEFLNDNNVNKIFAYNANFDFRHLNELDNFYWYDIMKIAANKKYNLKITDNMECCKSGRLKRNYGVESIYRLLSSSNVCETHNGLKDAIDELCIMKMLNLDLSIYENNANINSPVFDEVDIDTNDKKNIDKEIEVITDINLSNSVVIPSNITVIKEAYYKNNNMQNLYIHKGIRKIDYDAFKDCKALMNVYYNGSIESWCNITFSDYYSNPMYYASHFYLLNSDTNKYEEVTEIVIPNTITKIGDCQFCGFSNVKNITISGSVKSIGWDAFDECSKLKSLVLSEGVKSIGFLAFANCESLKEITIPSSLTFVDKLAFCECTSSLNVYYSGTVEDWCHIEFASYGSNPFSCTYKKNHFYLLNADTNRYEEVRKIVIPSSITKIGKYQLYGFSNVTKITIPSSVTSIGASAFNFCTSLISITIPGSVISIADNAFFNCESLQYNIYDNAYYLGDDINPYLILVKTWHKYINSCEINENTRFIYTEAFKKCRYLKNITLSKNVISILDNAFSYCSSLSDINYHGNITDWKIMKKSSKGNSSLKKATIHYTE